MSRHLLHVFSTFAPGGPQVRTARLLPELPSGWRHSVVALDGETAARALVPPEVAFEVLPAPPRAGTPRTTLALTRLLRRLRPDLLLTYNFGAMDAVLASNLVRVPTVHHEDGFRPDEVDAFKRRRVWLRRLFLPRTDAVVVPSLTLERIALETWKLAPGLVRRIPNGIRVEDFGPADGRPELRGSLGIPADAPVVGWVGHLRPEKNPVRAVVAFRHARPDAHLLVLGDGPERPAVEEAVARLELGERVHLRGHRADPREDYRAMDVLLISSDTEQMPVALLEAMATGLPVASMDVGDVSAILPPEQARCIAGFPAGSGGSGSGAEDVARRLARALEPLLADPDLRRSLGAANRARAESEYSFAGMVRAYRECYGALLERGA